MMCFTVFIKLLVVYGNFLCHLINQIIGLFSLSLFFRGLVHLYKQARINKTVRNNYRYSYLKNAFN